ncbi:hypothetical protein [Robbsia sp. KACC 23696]|uniref:hypothetical protein n=1 Tax=Robbsia sp. KACC 23696 TaxID=3149231 RepID=UPI00325A50CB
MSSPQPTTPQAICENILIEGKRYNIEHEILPSENAVADRLLSRSLELKDAYEELHEKLHQHPPALKVFLDLLLSTAAFWSPEKSRKHDPNETISPTSIARLQARPRNWRNCWSVARNCTTHQVSAAARTITSVM